MTLGQFLRGCVLQGNVRVVDWGDGTGDPIEEEWFQYQDGSGNVLKWAKEHKVLSKKVYWVYGDNGYLNIEITE